MHKQYRSLSDWLFDINKAKEYHDALFECSNAGHMTGQELEQYFYQVWELPLVKKWTITDAAKHFH